MTKLDLNLQFATSIAPRSISRPFVFVLLPGFSAMSLSTAVEVLAGANAAGASPVYCWKIVSADGTPATASTGLTMAVDDSLPDIQHDETIVLCGGARVDEPVDLQVVKWLRKAARHGAKLGAMGGGGTALLAQTGLSSGQSIASHWSTAPALQESFPNADITQSIFEISDKVITCPGGATALDLFINVVSQHNGISCAQTVAGDLACSSIRDKHTEQTFSIACQFGRQSHHLEQAIQVMKTSIEDPISPSQVAVQVGVSSRQLERLFSKHLNMSPKAFSTKLRLERARILLQQTDLAMIDVAIATGFQNTTHFSKLYKRRFGVTPSNERGVAVPCFSGTNTP
ncbi:GlxA family transcriptional regulator [uncultured Pelagimonas sp.]|uniref:GlxA family transcriptional regulator n=1 Tax=uncultured Pelagimonas sp. TaxID=1618102 RepID=UPI00262B9D5E|nr:GlxA family transcriptional regulator [uncultured Pelagimonas sp.]